MGEDNDLERAFQRWSCYTATPADSLALFEAGRGRCPLAHSEEHDGFHLLLSYRDVREATVNHRVFSSTPQVLRPMLPRKPVPGLEMDPPQHSQWRAIYNAAVTPKAVAAMEAHVRSDVRRHIDEFIELGACDLVRDLAEPVPAEAVCRLVGVDEDKVLAIREAAIAMFAAQGDPDEFAKRQAAFAAVTVTEIERRRAEPRDDFLTSLVDREVEGRKLDENDFVVLMAAFLGAGHHSTTSAMASLMYEVFSNPSVRDRLMADPAAISAAAEEALRLHPPFYGFFRRTKQPVELSGTPVEAGHDVYLGWAAANRDPTVFPRPECFELDRGENRHLSFGAGIHTCPGAPLARMELRVLMEELLSLLPDITLDVTEPQYQFGGGDYSFIPALPARFSPRARSTS